jgi:hypothetical protein
VQGSYLKKAIACIALAVEKMFGRSTTPKAQYRKILVKCSICSYTYSVSNVMEEHIAAITDACKSRAFTHAFDCGHGVRVNIDDGQPITLDGRPIVHKGHTLRIQETGSLWRSHG